MISTEWRPNMGRGKKFPKNPVPECVIRRNKYSYGKGYLTEEKLRVYIT